MNNSTTKNYIKFIQFVEAYYKFLELQTESTEVLQNIRNYADAEKTLDTSSISLVESFFKNYGYDLPRKLKTDNKAFVKHFKDIYKTKGTEESAKLLFRILFNNDIDFVYPSDYILKPSDGKWVKNKILLVTDVGDSNIFGLINSTITGQSSKATAKVLDVLKFPGKSFINFTNNKIYEIYLEDVRGNFTKELIKSNNSANILATTQYQIGSIVITNGAAGYQLSDSIYHEGTIAKITKVDEVGKIKEVSIINSEAFIVPSTISRNASSANSYYLVSTSNPSKKLIGAVSFSSNVGTFFSNFKHGLVSNDLANITLNGNVLSNLNDSRHQIKVLSVLDNTRFNFILSNSYNTTLRANLEYVTRANLYATFDILKTTNGFYNKNKGHPSDNYKIQGFLPNAPDTSLLYYQPFSYVLKSPQSTNKWRNIVKETIHPAGLELFGDVIVENLMPNKINSRLKSEVSDFLGITADNFSSNFTADSISVSYSVTRPRTFFKNAAPKKIAIFGDHVSTYGGLVLPTGADPTVYASYTLSQTGSITSGIQSLFPSYQIENISRGGMTTDEALTGVQTYVGPGLNNPFGSSNTITQWITDNNPSKIILRYGLADAVLINNSTTTLNNIQTIINFAVNKGIEVLLIGVNPSAALGTSAHCGYINGITNASNSTAASINAGLITKASVQNLKFANPRTLTAPVCSLPDGITPFLAFGVSITQEIVRQLDLVVPAADKVNRRSGITIPINADHVIYTFGYL